MHVIENNFLNKRITFLLSKKPEAETSGSGKNGKLEYQEVKRPGAKKLGMKIPRANRPRIIIFSFNIS